MTFRLFDSALAAVLGASIACALATYAAPVSAQSSKASAEALFAEGRRLMGDGKIDEACPKFADSQKLDPSSSTLLNLGNCYEKAGKTASAWATYQEAASLATANNRADHLQVAQKRAAALAATLPKITVVVTHPVDGLEVKRDGASVARAEFGLAVPVDPGSHTYAAQAPGYKGATVQILVPKTPDGGAPAKMNVTIPDLEKLPQAGPTKDDKPEPKKPRKDEPSWPAQRTGALVAGGLGLVGVGVGIAVAVVAKSKYTDSLAACRPQDPSKCTAEGVIQRDSARGLGTGASVAIGVGAAGLALGTILWFTSGGDDEEPEDRRRRSSRLHVAPLLDTRGSAGVMVNGPW